jgi:hypothetical protein
MATTTSRLGSFYNERRAASQLRKYRKKAPIASTQTLIDALNLEGVGGEFDAEARRARYRAYVVKDNASAVQR